MTLTNHRTEPVEITLGVKANFGSLNRVTYVPVELRGERIVGAAPWVDPAEVFSYITTDTDFAWALLHPGSKANITVPPTTATPSVDASQTKTLAPGESVESIFVLSAGIEEFSAAHNARALREQIDRNGAEAMIEQTAAWLSKRTRTTGQADLDLLMNRNFLFTELYAWGRTIDTEQFVGVTSRSPRYYVSAAYWDRDAMLWSFPALLDIDPPMARDALEYALTTQFATPVRTAASLTASSLKTVFNSTKLLHQSSPSRHTWSEPTTTRSSPNIGPHSRSSATGSSAATIPLPVSIPRCRIRRTNFRSCPSSPTTTPSSGAPSLTSPTSTSASTDLNESQEMTRRAAALHAGDACPLRLAISAQCRRSYLRLRDRRQELCLHRNPARLAIQAAGSRLRS